jgi:hypothetical protein
VAERHRGRTACAGLLLVLAAPAALAIEVERLSAEVVAGVYRVEFEARLRASPADVAHVLTDYGAYATLDPQIRRSEVEATAPGGDTRIRTRILACAGLFCRYVDRVESVRAEPGVLVAEVVPERSDLRHGRARTEWHAEGSGTRLTYLAEFEPRFWVPALVERRYAPGMLERSVLTVFTNVERYARGD